MAYDLGQMMPPSKLTTKRRTDHYKRSAQDPGQAKRLKATCEAVAFFDKDAPKPREARERSRKAYEESVRVTFNKVLMSDIWAVNTFIEYSVSFLEEEIPLAKG
jgi:hypothetical protein